MAAKERRWVWWKNKAIPGVRSGNLLPKISHPVKACLCKKLAAFGIETPCYFARKEAEEFE